MPIRFHCRRCNQLLAIAARKAGTEIECPRCGQWQGVPFADRPAEAGDAVEVSYPLAPPLPAAPPAADLFAPPANATNSLAAPPPASASHQPAAPPPANAASSSAAPPLAVPPGMVLVRRRVVHVLAAFFFTLTVAMFGLGYWLGREQSPPRAPAATVAAQAPALDPSLIEGRVMYETEAGKLVGDAGAVVLALAEGRPPAQPLDLAGAEPSPVAPDPKQPLSPERQKAAAALRAVGGAYARVEGQGSFSFVLRPGNYRVLVVSAHARRPKGDDVDEADLAEMRRYFASPGKLIGAMKYSWGTRPITSVGPGPRQDFGRDEGGGT